MDTRRSFKTRNEQKGEGTCLKDICTITKTLKNNMVEVMNNKSKQRAIVPASSMR